MKFGGIAVHGDTVKHGRESGPLAGAHASVDTAGEIDKRITATRLVLTGPFALAFRKKKDKRELYLTIEGDGFGWVVEVNPKEGKKAREFAVAFNAAASKVRPATSSAPLVSPPPPPSAMPAGWHPDPTLRHELRYFDGGRWTNNVSDQGQQSIG